MPRRAAILTRDLFFSSQIAGALRRGDCELTTAGSLQNACELCQTAPLDVLILDLAHGQLRDPSEAVTQLRALENPPRQIVGFAQHVHTERIKAARQAGCDLVTTRSDIIHQLEELLQG